MSSATRLVTALLGTVVVACQEPQQEIALGHALQKPRSAWTYHPAAPIPVGQEFLLVFMALRNVSEEPLVVRSIDPIGQQHMPEVAEVVRVGLVDRGPGIPSIPMGRYLTVPPVSIVAGRCVSGNMRPSRGYRLPPREASSREAVVATWVRAIAPGTAAFKAERVTYRQGGELFRQTLPLTIRVEVRRKAAPLIMEPSEKRCAHLSRVLVTSGERHLIALPLKKAEKAV